jgi:hypothetical protein
LISDDNILVPPHRAKVEKVKNHSFKGRVAGKQYCIYCGLVSLNNPFTDWCIRKGCEHEANPGYLRWTKKRTKRLSKEWLDWFDREIEKAEKRRKS